VGTIFFLVLVIAVGGERLPAAAFVYINTMYMLFSSRFCVRRTPAYNMRPWVSVDGAIDAPRWALSGSAINKKSAKGLFLAFFGRGSDVCAVDRRGAQQPKNQPTPRRTELRHGVISGVLSAVRLGLRLPSIFRRRRSFFLGFGLGIAQPGRRAARRRGGRRRGNAPAPAIFAQLLGVRGPLGLPEGPNRPKNGSLWAAGGSDISSRRADRATTHLKNGGNEFFIELAFAY
jgi:hypothetical protein